MAKVVTVEVSDVLNACERLAKIQSSEGTLVLFTARLFEEFKKVGSGETQSLKKSDGTASMQSIISMGIYGLHKISFIQLTLEEKTAWVATIQFDYKEFSAKLEKEIYVFDLV